ncbi:hypothetical protein Tco_1266529, partial [Tanacetum coccineum]
MASDCQSSSDLSDVRPSRNKRVRTCSIDGMLQKLIRFVRVWETHNGNMCRDIVRCVRKAVMKATRVNDNVDISRISSNRPNWIGEMIGFL